MPELGPFTWSLDVWLPGPGNAEHAARGRPSDYDKINVSGLGWRKRRRDENCEPGFVRRLQAGSHGWGRGHSECTSNLNPEREVDGDEIRTVSVGRALAHSENGRARDSEDRSGADHCVRDSSARCVP